MFISSMCLVQRRHCASQDVHYAEYMCTRDRADVDMNVAVSAVVLHTLLMLYHSVHTVHGKYWNAI